MRKILALAALLLSSTPAAAGPWNKPTGGGYAKLGSATFVSDVACDDEGVCASSTPFALKAETVFAYAEVGLSERLTLTTMIPFVFSTNASKYGVNFHTAGFADALIGAQVGLVQGGPVVVAARAEAKIPLYRGGPSVAGRQGALVPGFPRSSRFFPALGDGQLDVTAFLSLGASIPLLDAFVAVEPGYRYRSGGITDAFVFQGTAGLFILERHLLLLVNTQRVITLPPRDVDEVVGKAFWAIGPAAQIPIGRGLALEIGADALVAGQNAALGFQVLSGVSYVF